jgi:hypothetical protein
MMQCVEEEEVKQLRTELDAAIDLLQSLLNAEAAKGGDA